MHLVAVTLGRDGALIGNENGIVKAEGLFSSHAVDTTGAGDSFWGGFSCLLSAGRNLAGTPDPGADDSVRQGSATQWQSLCVERRGGISAIPEMEEIEERLRG